MAGVVIAWLFACDSGPADKTAETAPGDTDSPPFFGGDTGDDADPIPSDDTDTRPLPPEGITLASTEPNMSNFGLEWLPDSDGDGFDELVVGMQGYLNITWENASAYATWCQDDGLYVVPGGAPVGTTLSLQADARWWVDGGGDCTGRSVSRGDVDGDGVADVVYGAPWNWEAGGGWYDTTWGAGKVAVVLGVGAAGARTPVASWLGTSDIEEIGSSVAAIGDVDGDGMSEVAFAGQYGGRVYVATGSAAVTLGTSAADAGWVLDQGHLVEAVGDVDGDGLGDLLVGEGEERSVWLYLGAGLRSGNVPDVTFVGEGSGFARVGESISRAGDIDGDGLDDVLLGGFQSKSVVWLFSGAAVTGAPTVEVVDTSASVSLRFREDWVYICDPVDADGDGSVDLLFNFDPYGCLYAVPTTALPAAGVFEADPAPLACGRWYGGGVAVGGDWNGDGVADLAASSDAVDVLLMPFP